MFQIWGVFSSQFVVLMGLTITDVYLHVLKFQDSITQINSKVLIALFSYSRKKKANSTEKALFEVLDSLTCRVVSTRCQAVPRTPPLQCATDSKDRIHWIFLAVSCKSSHIHIHSKQNQFHFSYKLNLLQKL